MNLLGVTLLYIAAVNYWRVFAASSSSRPGHAALEIIRRCICVPKLERLGIINRLTTLTVGVDSDWHTSADRQTDSLFIKRLSEQS